MIAIKKFKAVIYKSTALDSYENGEIGEMIDHGIAHEIENKSLNDLSNEIEAFLGAIPYRYENRLEFSRLESEYYYYPTEFQIDLYKKGKINLYNAYYSIYISEINENIFEENEINHYFCDLKSEV